jgi:hypothetical protein
MHKHVREIYDDWYQNNKQTILQGGYQPLPKELLENPHEDTQRGLNLIAHIPHEVNSALNNHLIPELLPLVGQSGWIMPNESRHLTVLDILPHDTDPAILQEAAPNPSYRSVIREVLGKTTEPILVDFNGIFASPNGITVQGFPHGHGLENLRVRLREAINEAGLISTEANRYIRQTAHISLIKFTDKLEGPSLLETVDRLREIPLGTLKIQSLILNVSPRFDKSSTIEVLDQFSYSYTEM